MLVNCLGSWHYIVCMSEQIQEDLPESILKPEAAELEHVEEITSEIDDVPLTDPVRQYLREIGRVPLLNAEQEVDLSKRIEAGLFASRLLEVQADLKELKQDFTEEERILGQRYLKKVKDLQLIAADGAIAKHHLMEANLRLVVSIAKRYNGRGLDFLDIIQEGNLGLVRAVEKFDYTKGYKFSTYATWWIRQAITRGIADTARTIRLPVHMVETVNKYVRVERQLSQDLGRAPTHEELSKELGITVAKVKDLEDLAKDPIELDRKIGKDGDSSLGDFIEDTTTIRPEELVVTNSIQEDVRTVISQLDKRSAYIIKQRYGLDTGTAATLDEVGQELGLTRERIRQLQKKAETTLKDLFKKMGIAGPDS